MLLTAFASAFRPRLLFPTRAAALSVCLVVLGVAIIASLAFGRRQVGLWTSVEALLSYDAALADHIVVNAQRVPRMAIGLLAGAALGVAGAQIQGITRNPLASPDVIGLAAGASVFSVLAIAVFDAGMPTISIAALVGAGLGIDLPDARLRGLSLSWCPGRLLYEPSLSRASTSTTPTWTGGQ